MKFLGWWFNTILAALLLALSGSMFYLGSCLSLLSSVVFMNWELMSLGSASVEVPVVLDLYSCSFLGTVSVITGSVLMFSSSYMGGEKYYLRFHLLVLSFVFSMFLLILSPNLLSLLLGWDGLGVSSYLLVIYFQNSKSFNAGMLTVLINRFGDVLILVSIGFVCAMGSWDMFIWGAQGGICLSSKLCVILVVALFTKSAQIPFSAWLPAAMAAPTPVSALVHSSTLVTAGVYLLFRFHSWLAHYNSLLLFMLLVGSSTMIMAGGSAMYEKDMKKIVALSTLSQLGLMVASLGLGFPVLAFFHLLAHAFFKALLFIAVGNLIHLSYEYQDLRKVSASSEVAIVSLGIAFGANLSLCGFPFLAGFFSKDLILEYMNTSVFASSVLLLFYSGVMFTLMYSARMVHLLINLREGGAAVAWSLDYDFSVLSGMMKLWFLTLVGAALVLWVFNTPLHPALPGVLKSIIPVLFLLVLVIFFSIKKLREIKPQPSSWDWGSMWGLPYAFHSTLSYSSAVSGDLNRYSDLVSNYQALTGFLNSLSVGTLKENSNLLVHWVAVLGYLGVLVALGVLI